jgi:hypothetical protein
MPQAGNDVPMGLKNTETACAATAGLMITRDEKLFSVRRRINSPIDHRPSHPRRADVFERCCRGLVKFCLSLFPTADS